MSSKVLRFFNSYKHLYCSVSGSYFAKYNLGKSCHTRDILLRSSITTSNSVFISKDVCLDDEKPKETKVKRPPVPKVTLLGPDNDIVIVAAMEEVQKIATKKDLRLVKIVDLDAKTQRPIYKMMTEAQYLEEDFQVKKERKSKKSKHLIKGEKLVLISERITDNDLEQRIKKLMKWLSSKYEVRIIISCPGVNKSSAERIYKVVENTVKGGLGTIVQKRYKEIDLRFSVLPPKVPVTPTVESNENQIRVEANKCSEESANQ